MKLKSLFSLGLLTFVVVSLGVAVADVAGLRSSAPVETTPPASMAMDEQWIAYYFHGSHRCPTCRGIEAGTRAALADQIAVKAVVLRVVNYEEPTHKHFADEFGLAFPTVILTQVQDGSTIRWKNLERVWDVWEDRPAFVSYVQTELAKFKEGRP